MKTASLKSILLLLIICTLTNTNGFSYSIVHKLQEGNPPVEKNKRPKTKKRKLQKRIKNKQIRKALKNQDKYNDAFTFSMMGFGLATVIGGTLLLGLGYLNPITFYLGIALIIASVILALLWTCLLFFDGKGYDGIGAVLACWVMGAAFVLAGIALTIWGLVIAVPALWIIGLILFVLGVVFGIVGFVNAG